MRNLLQMLIALAGFSALSIFSLMCVGVAAIELVNPLTFQSPRQPDALPPPVIARLPDAAIFLVLAALLFKAAFGWLRLITGPVKPEDSQRSETGSQP